VANAGGAHTLAGPLEQVSEEGWHAAIKWQFDRDISDHQEFFYRA